MLTKKTFSPVVSVLVLTIVGFFICPGLLSAQTDINTDFSETGNIVNWNVIQEQYTDIWNLVYSKPGAPALEKEIIFPTTNCIYKEGAETKSCQAAFGENLIINGDRVKIKGKTG
ncbi:unnamed protein product, partial [marine sediment metagenome]